MSVEQLLKERDSCLLRERRAVDRHPFARPVKIATGRQDEAMLGFARDISTQGIGIIEQIERAAGTIAELDIHSVLGPNITVRAEVRWSEAFGDGWFVNGWAFIE